MASDAWAPPSLSGHDGGSGQSEKGFMSLRASAANVSTLNALDCRVLTYCLALDP